ncbi:MAG: cytochrome c oxidase subunit II [Nocardioides sp.]|nr:cytochrome c oxidase subunit II [Nocardioides sp.]
MGLQLPKGARRVALAVMLGMSLLVLGACTQDDKDQVSNFAMPGNSPGTEQGAYIADLWKYAWIAALIVGAIVWGLIFFISWYYRRRSDDDIPVQTRYNLPLEIFYTIAPIFMVIVFFYWTVITQDKILEDDPNPDQTIEVVGQQWSWTFNHSYGDGDPGGPVVYTAGTASQIPTLVLPVGETIEFKLSSPDVIHSFWITGFLMKMDVIPGQTGEDRNSFQVNPLEEGTFRGKCAELCGVYHSRMLFDVEVVSQSEYDQYLEDLKAKGNYASEPLLGGADASTQAGLEESNEPEGGQE